MSALVFLLFAKALAADVDLLSTAQKKASVISGVLNPASLSFNGNEIFQSQTSFEALLLNDHEIPATEVSGFKSFFVSTDEDTIDLKWVTNSGQKQFILQVQYPAVSGLTLRQNELDFEFNRNTKTAVLDGEKLPLEGVTSSFEVSHMADWLNDPHSLELTNEKTSRIYNLDFRNLRSGLLTKKSLSLIKASAPFWSMMDRPSMYGVGYRIQTEDRKSNEYIFSLAGTEYSMTFPGNGPANSTVQQAMELKYRYGYNPFETNSGNFNYRRLTAGLYAALTYYHRKSDFANSVDGVFSDKVDQLRGVAGFFLRWEPLQYRQWGLAVCVEPRVLRTQENNIGDGGDPAVAITYAY